MISAPNIRRRLPLALGIVVAFLVSAIPVAAHAINITGIFGLGDIAFGAIFSAVLGLVVMVNAMIGQLFSAVGTILTFVLSWSASTQLTAVARSWTIVRDMCNMVFIILLVLISFATIFGTFGFFRNWHYRSALIPLIIAAIVMNFSLAIGQTVVLLSNQASKILLTSLGDPTAMLIQALNPNQLVLAASGNSAKILSALSQPITDTTKTRTAAENARYQQCLKEYVTPGQDSALYGFLRNVSSTVAIGGAALDVVGAVQKTATDCNAEIFHARLYASLGVTAQEVAQAQNGSATPDQKIMLIASGVFTAILMIIITSCLFSALIFFILRILMVWILLALSPVAWLSFAIPGKTKFKQWWNQFLAWNIFGPFYLLMLIPGMVMLGGTAQMALTLGTTPGSPLQLFLMYAFALIVFVGALALALKSSFAGTIKSSGAIGALASKLGVFDSYGAPLKALSRVTGVESRAKGAVQGVTSIYERNISAPLKRREEEATARYRAAFGDRSALEKLERTRIDEQTKKNKEGGATIRDLRSDFAKGATAANRTKYLAAAKTLLEEGELNDQEMRAYMAEAGKVSPALGQSAREAVQKKAKEKLKEKKYKTVDDVFDTMEQLQLNKPDNERELKSFLGNLKSNQPLLYAKLAGNTKGVPVTDKDGNSLTTSQILEDLAPKLSDEEWIAAYEDQMPLGENASYVLNSKLTSKGDYNKLLRMAKKETREKLAAEIKQRRKEQVRNQMEEREEAKKIRQEVENERKQQQQPPKQ